MKLNHGMHLAYCTNVHRGETWEETFDSLKRNTLQVRERVCPEGPYGIGLRLKASAWAFRGEKARLFSNASITPPVRPKLNSSSATRSRVSSSSDFKQRLVRVV